MKAWTLRALFVLLAPLLMVQGRYTRAVTPRLPEPPGPREGRTGQGPALRLLIAGDSAAAGVGVDEQSAALSGHLVANLAPHFDVHWKLIAQTGYCTRDLLTRLRLEPAQPFDVAVLSLGVNDVTGLVRTPMWLEQQRELLDLLHQRLGIRHVLLTRVPPMHAFSALPQPLRALLGLRARALNGALEHAASRWGGEPRCELLGFEAPVHPEALAPDGFHPGAATYRQWGRVAAQRVLSIAGEGAPRAGRDRAGPVQNDQAPR